MEIKNLKNLKKVAQRIIIAIKNKEKIILFSDSDLDGITSLIILKEAIKNLGGEIGLVYFSFREDGYGLNKKALRFLKSKAPALLICLDLGIGNFEEVKIAQKYGFEVIIVDHHDILGKLPPASIIVDPKQKGDKYPLKSLANVGIVFKLSKEILPKSLFKELERNFLELTSLGTIADLMPQIGENKEMIEKGIKSLKTSERIGIRVFFERDFIKNSKTNSELASRIISLLNAGQQKKDNLTETYLILSASEISKARKILSILLRKNQKRKLKIKEIISEIEKRVSKQKPQPIIFEGKNNWPLVRLGSAASKICQKYKKPIFLFKKKKNLILGSIRSPKDINNLEALKSCSKFLKTYGGHPQASGFYLKEENLERFKNCLIEYYKEFGSKI